MDRFTTWLVRVLAAAVAGANFVWGSAAVSGLLLGVLLVNVATD